MLKSPVNLFIKICNKVPESGNLLQVKSGNFGCQKNKNKIGEVCRDRTQDLTNACFFLKKKRSALRGIRTGVGDQRKFKKKRERKWGWGESNPWPCYARNNKKKGWGWGSNPRPPVRAKGDSNWNVKPHGLYVYTHKSNIRSKIK